MGMNDGITHKILGKNPHPLITRLATQRPVWLFRAGCLRNAWITKIKSEVSPAVAQRRCSPLRFFSLSLSGKFSVHSRLSWAVEREFDVAVEHYMEKGTRDEILHSRARKPREKKCLFSEKIFEGEILWTNFLSTLRSTRSVFPLSTFFRWRKSSFVQIFMSSSESGQQWGENQVQGFDKDYYE